MTTIGEFAKMTKEEQDADCAKRYAAKSAEAAELDAWLTEEEAKPVSLIKTPVYIGRASESAQQERNAVLMAQTVESLRTARYVVMAKEEIGKAVRAADEDSAMMVRCAASSQLADRIALDQGATLLTVTVAHVELADTIIAAIPLYAAGWTDSPHVIFADKAQALEFIASELEAVADDDTLDDQRIAELTSAADIVRTVEFRNAVILNAGNVRYFATTV